MLPKQMYLLLPITNTKMFVWLNVEINLKKIIYIFGHQKIPQLVIFQLDQLYSLGHCSDLTPDIFKRYNVENGVRT